MYYVHTFLCKHTHTSTHTHTRTHAHAHAHAHTHTHTHTHIHMQDVPGVVHFDDFAPPNVNPAQLYEVKSTNSWYTYGYTGLFCREVGLFWKEKIGLFCEDMRLCSGQCEACTATWGEIFELMIYIWIHRALCREVGLFCREVGLFCEDMRLCSAQCEPRIAAWGDIHELMMSKWIRRAFLQRCRALLQRFRALLQRCRALLWSYTNLLRTQCESPRSYGIHGLVI